MINFLSSFLGLSDVPEEAKKSSYDHLSDLNHERISRLVDRDGWTERSGE